MKKIVQKKKSIDTSPIERKTVIRKNYFESLESRVLLTSFTWAGVDGNLWSIPANWTNETTHESAAIAPGAADDVTIGGNVSVEISSNIAVNNLTIQGLNANITVSLTLDNNCTLTVAHTTATDPGGNITLVQGAGYQTSFSVVSQGLIQPGTLNATNLISTGDPTGSTTFTVGDMTKVNLTGNLNAQQNMFSATIGGPVIAANIYFSGATIPTTGPSRSSAIVVSGVDASLISNGTLKIGSNGNVALHAQNGTLVRANEIDVYNQSSMDTDHSQIIGTKAVYIGDGPGASLQSGGINLLTGAIVNARDNGVISGGNLTIAGGNAVLVQASTGSGFLFTNVLIENGELTHPLISTFSGTLAPQVIILGTGSTLAASGNVTISTNGGIAPTLQFLSGGTGAFDGILNVQSLHEDDFYHVTIDANSTVTASSLEMRHLPGSTALQGKSARVLVEGKLILTAVAAGNISNDYHTNAVLDTGKAGNITLTAVGASLIKGVFGDIKGNGTIYHAVTHTKGPLSDIMPGDYFSGQDSDGNPIINPTPDPDTIFGTLTLDGDLDASDGMTLDEVMGNSTNQNSNLTITGNATLNGDLNVFLASGVSSTSYANGTSFTLLSANGTLSGEFSNLPEGFYTGDGTLLPTLSSGLKWWVHYTNHNMTLSVHAPSLPLATFVSASGIQTTAASFDIGGASVSIYPFIISNLGTGELQSSFTSVGNIIGQYGNVFPVYSPSEGWGGFSVQIVEQVVGNILRVAIIDSNNLTETWDVTDRIVVFYGETNFTPGQTTADIQNMISESDIGNIFDNTGFDSMVSFPQIANGEVATPFLAIGYGGNITINMNYTSNAGLKIDQGFSTTAGANVTISMPDPTSTILDVSDGTTTEEFDAWSLIGLSIYIPPDQTAPSVNINQSNGDLPVGYVSLENGGKITIEGGTYSNPIYSGYSGNEWEATDGAIITIGDSAYYLTYIGSLTLDPGTTAIIDAGNVTSLDSFIHMNGNFTALTDTNLTVPLISASYGGWSVTSTLEIAGTANIGGHISITDGDVGTAYSGESFTILSASDGLTGQFTNLPAGYDYSPDLPQLSPGYVWYVTYTSTAVTMEVLSTSLATNQNINFTPDGDLSISQDPNTPTNLLLSDDTQSDSIPLANINSLTINSGSNNENISLNNSGANLSLPSGLNLVGTGNITLTLSNGSYTFNSDPGANAPNLSLYLTNSANVTFNASQTLAALTIDSGTTLTTSAAFSSTAPILNNGTLAFTPTSNITIASSISGTGGLIQNGNATTTLTGNYTATGPITLSTGNLTFANTTNARQDTGVVIKTSNLTIASGSILDVTNHDLIIGNTNYTTIQGAILYGFGDGTGNISITSSTAIANGNKFLVAFSAAAFGITSWDNVTLTDPNTIIVKFTWFGDINVDGQVDAGDYATLDQFFGPPAGPGGSIVTGDADLSGVIDAGDYAFLDQFFGDGVGNPL